MGTLVVALLLGLWASILLPGLLRARREAALLTSISTFERCMSMLAPADSRLAVRPSRTRGPGPGRHVLVLGDPAAFAGRGRRSRVLRRRRALLARLSGTTAVAVLAGVLVGGWAWTAAAVVGASLAAYVALLLQLRGRETELRRKVRRLPAAARPALDLGTVDVDALLAPAAGDGGSGVEVRSWQV